MIPLLSTTSTPYSTQEPTSIKDSLPSYGIYIENAEKWNHEYNYENIPHIYEHKFWGLLIDVASDANPADPEFKSIVRSVMEQKIAQFCKKFKEQVYEIMLSGAELFQDQSQESVFLSALDEQYNIYGYESFIVNCLLVLVNVEQPYRSYAEEACISSSAKDIFRIDHTAELAQ
ncbi:uncharacterized protein PAC_19081 [Phialocephala subalpina]|uniref:Uncharacterized protein n=1 Tax=Phialocephala subalpina TaxID=576137 RepID=A0A1L7XVW2_9HELO|nr:uncharacterized protein PAC_19081 [Phialocephala subalpina]